MSVARLFLAAALLGTAAPAAHAAHAQDSTTITRVSPPYRWMFGGSVGLPGYERETVPQLFTVAAHWTYFRPNAPGADFSFGVAPRLIGDGIAAAGARAGVAVPFAVAPDVFLLPSAGLSVLGAVGSGGGDGIAGANAGGALVLRGRGDVGLRAGVTWHWLPDTGGAPWLLEVGVVRLPTRALLGR